MIFNRKKTYMFDENVKMSDTDIDEISNDCKVINSTDIFKKGAKDEILTQCAKEEGYIIVTKDIRMALRSLVDGVPVIYVSDDFQTISFLKVDIYGRKKYPRIFDYLQKRFGFN